MLLYIHIPFCRRKCHYCDFFRSTCLDSMNAVVDKIASDIRSSDNAPLETVYFGGGTPSLLSREDFDTIFSAIHETYRTENVRETTVEANPDDITLEYCAMLLDHGADRLSIGVQSFFDSHLKAMNRRHDGRQAIAAIETARKAGFSNITADLIYGLPFMTADEWRSNIETMAGLGVEHISAYHLTIEPGTVFGHRNLQPVTEETSQMHYDVLLDMLQSFGYRQYEISNFAKPGFEAVHNSGYWTGKPYTGVGPSAHSFDGVCRRWWQPRDIGKWLNNEGTEEEFLTREERREEIVMTSLRTVKGLQSPDREILEKAESFISQGLMEYSDGHLRIPPRHFLLSDYIIGELV